MQHHSVLMEFFITCRACYSNLPSLYYFAASRLIAECRSGWISMLWIECTIYCTFLLGNHSFSPTIYWQMSPSFTLGCQIGVLNLTIGNLKGNCSGKSKSTTSSPPS